MRRAEAANFLDEFRAGLDRFRINLTVDLDRSGKLTEECKRRLIVYAHDALPWPEDHPLQDPEEQRKEKMRRGSPELQAFSQQVTRQIEEAGFESGIKFVEANPGKHIWGTMSGIESCAFCGVCRSRSPKGNGPCKGIARISLR
jgi:hypothetical protein